MVEVVEAAMYLSSHLAFVTVVVGGHMRRLRIHLLLEHELQVQSVWPSPRSRRRKMSEERMSMRLEVQNFLERFGQQTTRKRIQ